MHKAIMHEMFYEVSDCTKLFSLINKFIFSLFLQSERVKISLYRYIIEAKIRLKSNIWKINFLVFFHSMFKV